MLIDSVICDLLPSVLEERITAYSEDGVGKRTAPYKLRGAVIQTGEGPPRRYTLIK